MLWSRNNSTYTTIKSSRDRLRLRGHIRVIAHEDDMYKVWLVMEEACT
jgi:hypothetical protein